MQRRTHRHWYTSPVTRSAVAAAGALAVLAACGSSSSGSAGGSTATSAAPNHKNIHLAYVYAATDENFAQEMALGAKQAADDAGVSLTETAPPAIDGAAEVQAFDSAMQTSKAGIGMETLTPPVLTRPLEQAYAQKIPVIAVDAPPVGGAKTALFIGNSNYALGVDLANALLPQIPNNKAGKILIGTDTVGLNVLVARNKGFTDTIKKARPQITFYNFNSQQTPTQNYNNWKSAVQRYPDALAYVGPGSQDATSMAQIERQTGKKYVVGADDLDPVGLQGVASGLVTALVSPEHWLKGYIAMTLLANHAISGAKIPAGWWNPGSLVVTKANVAKIQARQKSEATRAAYFIPIAKAQMADPSKYIKPLSDIS